MSVTRWCTVGSPGCAQTDDTDDFEPLYAGGGVLGYMAGSYPGTTPTGIGSATWMGLMVGMEDLDSASLERERPDVFLGDANIVIGDLAAPAVDVSFTNIHNVTEGTRHRDMGWQDLALEDGLFGAVSQENGGERYDYLSGCSPAPRIRRWAAGSAGTVSREPSAQSVRNSETRHAGKPPASATFIIFDTTTRASNDRVHIRREDEHTGVPPED